jgi:hypothetical protein
MTVHTFRSTGRAYDACQCDDSIKDGDVLVVEAEQVVGVANTWPVAVTRRVGQLHAIKSDDEQDAGKAAERWALSASSYCSPEKQEHNRAALLAGWHEARRVAAERGWELGPPHDMPQEEPEDFEGDMLRMMER